MAELADDAWIIRAEGHPVGELLLLSAQQAGFQPSIAFEANDYQDAQAMVAVGLGVTILPRLTLARLRDDVRLMSLGRQVPARRVLRARLASRSPTAAESRMASLLQEITESSALSPHPGLLPNSGAEA